MLGYLRGQVLSSISEGDGKLIVGVGNDATGMVGYSVNVPKSGQYDLLPHGKVIELFIYTHVREDQLELFGFATRSEKELFLTLLSVNGIGPKGALSILSGCEPSVLIQAVIEGDKQLLTKVPGIGKKTAERVVLELADPFKKKIEAGGFADFRSNTPGKAQNSGKESKTSAAMSASHASIRDARDALVGLGYRESDVSSLLNKVFAEFENPPRTEELIKTALRQLA